MTKGWLAIALSVCISFPSIGFAQDQSAVRRALSNIRNKGTTSRKLLDTSRAVSEGGLAFTGLGAIFVHYEVLDRRWMGLFVKVGFGTVAIAGLGAVSAVVLAFVESKPAGSVTLTDHFLTAEGFERFLSLPTEDIENFTTLEPRLANLLLEFSAAVDEIEAGAAQP